ncbi:TPA: site-specific DNA-methyltransferase [Enterococcus faecalis]|nr:site-specific DNA-methyltransferase [Enterococcus faecalis]
METKLNQEIKTVLEKFDDKYFIDGIVNKSKVIRDLDSYDADLVKELLSNDELKKCFTMEIADATVIKVNDLIDVFEQDEYWQDSYTKYSKKIGLTVNGKFLDETSEVVLDFPYKDTVLKASMSKEDTDQEDLKPEEPFLNEVIAQDEIDTLLDKKILINAKRYTRDGVEEANNFDGDNLIIKGNNLLGLHTIKEKFVNRVKMIYIDPPYNTGNDSFEYNDKFNHSAWLVFMKNRLEIAYELLSDDGIIAIQTDYHENSYIRILLDEIFGQKNYVSEIAVQMSTASGPKMANIASNIPKLKDSIIIFAKGNFEIIEQPYKPKSKWDKEYSKILTNFTKQDRKLFDQYMSSYNYEEAKEIIEKVTLTTLSKAFKEESKSEDWKKENSWRIVADKQNTGLDNLLANSDQFWNGDISLAKTKTGNLTLFRTDKKFGDDTRVEIVFADKNLKEHTGDLWTDISTSGGFSAEGGVTFPTAKKPERLLQRLIAMFTREEQIVLDFFMGSASTQAVAMKMNRRFIGIEQMDYIDTVSTKRLMNVINGDQTGISQEVNWQGGSSFVYAELMEKNTGFIKEIVNAKDMTELQAIFKRMMETADFDFRVDLEELQKDDLWQQAIDDQKRLMIKVIDKNQLYYNYAEIDDENVRDLISDSDYEFNKSFYADRGE